MKTLYIPPLLVFLFLSLHVCEAQFPSPHFELVEHYDFSTIGFVTSSCQDEQGFLWLGTPGGLRRFDGYEMLSYDPINGASNSISHPVIWDLACDGENLWTGTENGLNLLHLPTDNFTHFFHYQGQNNSLSDSYIETVFLAKNKDLWVGTGNGWNRKSKDGAGFVRYFFEEKKPRPARGIWEDDSGHLWLSAADSLYCLDPQGQPTAAYGMPGANHPGSPSKNLIRILYGDSQGYLWIGTDQNGLFKFDPEAGKVLQHFKKEADENSLAHNRISAMLEEGGYLWVGTYGGGLHFLDLQSGEIHRCMTDEKSGLKATVVRSIFKDRTGNIWLGTEYEGFWVVKKHGTPFHIFNLSDNGFRAMKIASLAESTDGKVWLAATDGLHRFDPGRGKFEHFFFRSNDFSTKYIGSLGEDKNGTLWLNTSDELYRWKGGSRFEPFIKKTAGGEYCRGWITTFLHEKNGGIWVGSMEGLCRYLPEEKQFRAYDLPPEPEGHSSNRSVFQIMKDRSGRLWVCTKSGLNLYQPENDNFKYYPLNAEVFQVYEDMAGQIWVFIHQGFGILDLDSGGIKPFELPGPTDLYPSAVLSERDGAIWFLSYSGIHRYDTAEKELTSYDTASGLGTGGFLHRNSMQTNEGYICLAGFNWFTYFQPDKITANQFLPATVLTKIDVLNQPVTVKNSEGDTLDFASPLNKKINYATEIELKHWQNDVALTFAAMDFSIPENNKYRYRLLGYDSTWVHRDASQRFATFTNLDPGEYTFEVVGSNSDGRLNEAQPALLDITILPPWWATWWARLIWVGLFIFILLLARRYEINRQLARAEAQRLAELDTVKSELYANITHEFRTPLTIILGLTEQLKSQASEGMKTSLDVIRRNGKQLLNLVNQLLDLAKLESGHLELSMVQGEIIGYSKYIAESFESLAKQKNIQLGFSSQEEVLTMDYDPVRLRQVLVNLLSNAIKFTPGGGKVNLQITSSGKHLQMTVRDTGFGIRERELPYIFDRFYQSDSSSTRKGEGTGIGLALAKEMVRLMGGDISVESKIGEGTTFAVVLPITQLAKLEFTAPPSAEIEKLPEPINEAKARAIEPQAPESKDKPLLLIVEDNADVLRYIASCLRERYRLAYATDGQQGIERALQLIPDLIISDVMMPVMDGFELCEALKLNERTSHIPIILLTAKADTSSRLSGLSKGADAYLTKPFDESELLARVKAMLELRKRLQNFYGKWTGVLATKKFSGDLQAFDSERLFLEKARKQIEENLADPGFNVNRFAKELHMSKSQLYRKMTGVTGKSANDFITGIRLQHAKKLLRQGQLSISEVAFQSGFAEPNYFSRLFKKEFEMSPSEFRMKVF